MQWKHIAESLVKSMGYHPSVLRYPYRVKTKKGRVELVRDPSKGLKK